MSTLKKKKPRTEYVYGVTKGVVTQLQFTFDTGAGEISFGPNVTNTYSEITYDRPKGPKILSRVPQPTEFLTFSTDDALQKNYDFLCAVDTNTRKVHGQTIAVTGIVTVTHNYVPGPNGFRTCWHFDVPFALAVLEPKASAEHLGWLGAYQKLREFVVLKGEARVGLIVDSDLRNISAFNNRKKAVVGSFYLPPDAQLIYATSDAGKENVINKALGTADSVAAQALRALDAMPPLKFAPPGNEWFDGVEVMWPRSKMRLPV
jgi:hypothetical protein